MRSDFMLVRFACIADDNAAVIMQVQFPPRTQPLCFTLCCMFQSTRCKGIIKCATALSLMLFIMGHLLRQGRRRSPWIVPLTLR